MSQDRIRELEHIIEQQNHERKELYARIEKAEDMVRILEQVIKHQNSQGAVGEAVAITADGRVYHGSAMPGKIRNRYLERLLDRIGRASIFVFDLLRPHRADKPAK